MNSKGITPIITIALLLLVAIGITATASIYISSLVRTSGTTTQEQINVVTKQLAKTIKIENAKGTNVTIRNIGSESIDVEQISVYVDGVKKDCTWSGSIAPQTTKTCVLAASCSGSVVRAVGPGNEHSVTCE
ncbi:MAG: hypothetical protein J7J38_02845 [Candidatus Aenigmarchaeota archaeon]|nr:hypothetical protein [Candidatus Aenigmarchaeota archaeon]